MYHCGWASQGASACVQMADTREFSIPIASFFCEPKTALKKSKFSLKVTYIYRMVEIIHWLFQLGTLLLPILFILLNIICGKNITCGETGEHNKLRFFFFLFFLLVMSKWNNEPHQFFLKTHTHTHHTKLCHYIYR